MQDLYKGDPDESSARPATPAAAGKPDSGKEAGTYFLIICYGLALILLIATVVMFYRYILTAGE